MADQIVNGVNIGYSPSLPADGLCPTCREPFYTVEVSTPVLVETKAGTFERVEAPKIEGPYFVPCKHDARSCFPPARAR